jgi:hypothetical protein
MPRAEVISPLSSPWTKTSTDHTIREWRACTDRDPFQQHKAGPQPGRLFSAPDDPTTADRCDLRRRWAGLWMGQAQRDPAEKYTIVDLHDGWALGITSRAHGPALLHSVVAKCFWLLSCAAVAPSIIATYILDTKP